MKTYIKTRKKVLPGKCAISQCSREEWGIFSSGTASHPFERPALSRFSATVLSSKKLSLLALSFKYIVQKLLIISVHFWQSPSLPKVEALDHSDLRLSLPTSLLRTSSRYLARRQDLEARQNGEKKRLRCYSKNFALSFLFCTHRR